MKNPDRVCYIINARLDSKRVPRKMLRDLDGTNLLDIALKKVEHSEQIPIEQFYLAAYEDDILDRARQKGMNVFKRSEQSSQEEGSLTSLYEWWDQLDYDYVVLINPCLPFLGVRTIDSFVERYLTIEQSGLFAVVERKNYYWDAEGQLITPLDGEFMNTKVVPPTYEAAHCLYASSMKMIGEGQFMGDFTPDKPALFVIEQEFEAMDVDYEWQFTMAEDLWKSGW